MDARTDPHEERERDILDSTEAGGRIIRGGVLRTAGYVAGAGLSVISAAVLTRYLGPADFGRYSVVFALLTIVTGVVDAGTATLGIREHSVRRGAAAWTFLRHLLGIRLALAAAGVAGALVFAAVAGYDRAMVAGTAAGGLGVVLLVLYGTLSIPLYSSLRLGWVTNLDLIRQGLTVVGLVGLAAVGAGIVPLLAVPVPVGLVLVAVTIVLVEREGALWPAVDRAEWAAIARLVLPFAAATVSAILYAHVSVLALSLVATERETGLFSAAFRVYFVVATIPGLLVQSAFPLLARSARDDRERLAYAVRRLWEACVVVGGGAALLMAIGAPVALDVVAGEGYSGAVDELRLLAIALMGTFVIALGSFTLLSLERYTPLVAANLVALVLSAGLAGGLGGSLGTTAGALGVVAADTALALMYVGAIVAGRRGITLPLAVVPKTLIAAALAASPLLIGGIPALVDALLAALIFTGAAVALRAVPEEIAAAMPPLRGRRG